MVPVPTVEPVVVPVDSEALPLAVAVPAFITFIKPAAPMGEKFWGIRAGSCPPPPLSRLESMVMPLAILVWAAAVWAPAGCAAKGTTAVSATKEAKSCFFM